MLGTSVTHLEGQMKLSRFVIVKPDPVIFYVELTFWLFLIHQGPERRDWFSSTEFKTWGAGK